MSIASFPKRPANVAYFLKQRLQSLAGPLTLLGPASVWLLLFLVLPTLLILDISLAPGFRPGESAGAYGLGNYSRVFNPFDAAFDPVFMQVILRSFYYATGATLACLCLGFPVAYWLALMAPLAEFSRRGVYFAAVDLLSAASVCLDQHFAPFWHLKQQFAMDKSMAARVATSGARLAIHGHCRVDWADVQFFALHGADSLCIS